MCACYNAMHHNAATSVMSAEAAASVCVFLLLGSAILAESIFAFIVGIILAVILIIKQKAATAS